MLQSLLFGFCLLNTVVLLRTDIANIITGKRQDYQGFYTSLTILSWTVFYYFVH